jgi:hypothetical protein
VGDVLDLAGLPFVDAHMHAPLRVRPSTPAAYRWPWFEGQAEHTGPAAELGAYRWGMHELASILGCDAAEDAVLAALAARDPLAWTREVVSGAGVAGLVVDTGYPPPEQALGPRELAEQTGVAVAPLLRLEHRAGEIAASAASFADFLDRLDAELDAVRANGYVGLKSVIAYRTGLRVGSPTREEAADAYGRARGAPGPVRLAEKALLDFLLLRALAVARRDALPLQLHTGYGDTDLDLREANPLGLRPLLEGGAAVGVPVVLLHGAWPYTAEAAYLAAVYPHVYLDVATCVPPLGWSALVEAWRVALAVAPLTRIHASSDAAGLIEQVAVGAVRARRTLAVALSELVHAGALSLPEAERAAGDILAGTARQLYPPPGPAHGSRSRPG